MTKYSKGETSPEIKKLSDDITFSIIEKTKLIKRATNCNPIPDYIPLSKNKTKINIGDVHAWESEELGIVKYAYNSANNNKNRKHFINLKKAISDLNHVLATQKAREPATKLIRNSTYKTREELGKEVKELNNIIATLDREIVEIFRAYNQLRSFITTHKFDNKKYHEILKQQTKTNNNRLRSVQ